MEILNTLTLKNVLDTSLTELVPALSKFHTLRNLELGELNSEGIALLCQWLPTCHQLENLKLCEKSGSAGMKRICTISTERFESQYCTTEFTNQIISHIPKLIIHVQVMTFIYNGEKHSQLPPYLLELIPRMEILNTLTLQNVLDTSLTEIIPALSKVPTLRNLKLHKMNSEGITHLCQCMLLTCQLETLTLPFLLPDNTEMVSRVLISLKTLNIERSMFTFQSMQVFAFMLQQNQSLTVVNIRDCHIDGYMQCQLSS